MRTQGCKRAATRGRVRVQIRVSSTEKTLSTQSKCLWRDKQKITKQKLQKEGIRTLVRFLYVQLLGNFSVILFICVVILAAK